MKTPLDMKKTLACVALICKANGGVVDLYRLVKTVYLADRKSFVETFRPITGDLWVNMRYGPVNSSLYDLTKGKGELKAQRQWNEYFKNGDNSVFMRKEPPLGCLTGLEVEAVKNAIDYLKDCGDFFSIRDKVHKLPEYEETNSSVSVDVSKILKAEYKDITDEQVRDLLEDIGEMKS